jgi:two-component system cell cycle response regulator DivK
MAGERVLIVEDNPRNLKLARDLLQMAGFRTIEATTGEDAVTIAQYEQPQLVLLDIQLPDRDGGSVLEALRNTPSTQRIPVVALTAFAMRGDRERFLAAGFDGYISKPISVTTFAQTVQQLCEEFAARERA